MDLDVLVRGGPPDEKDKRKELRRWIKGIAASGVYRAWSGKIWHTAVLTVLVIAGIVLIPVLIRSRLSPLWVSPVWIMFLFLTRRQLSRATVQPNTAASAVAEGICGSCGYSLVGLAPMADGCLVCPECGAAWRASRMKTWLWREGEASAKPAPWIEPGASTCPTTSKRVDADANGRLVPLLDSKLANLPEEARRGLGERVEEISREVRRDGAVARWWLAIAVVMAWGVVGARALWTTDDAGGFTEGVVAIGLGVVLGFISLGSDIFIRNERKTAVIIGHGVCPACAASLDEAKRDELNQLVCVWCGSAWRG